MHGKIINQCRLCNKKKLVKVINFGKIPLGNNLLAKKSLSIKAKKYPLILKNCQNCNHFQLNLIGLFIMILLFFISVSSRDLN